MNFFNNIFSLINAADMLNYLLLLRLVSGFSMLAKSRIKPSNIG